jgi:hypothetical protein
LEFGGTGHQSKQRGTTSGIKVSLCVGAVWKDGRDQPKIVKRKSKKEKGKALAEPKLAPPNGKKCKRVCYTKDQMATDALAKAIELSLKAGYTPSQELLKFRGVNPKEEEEVTMGMDNLDNLGYGEKESPHEEEPYEEEPLYEEGPSKPKVRTPHIASFATFNTTPPQEADKDKEAGGEEKEEATMDDTDEEQQEEGETRSGRSRLKCLTPKRRGTSKCTP